MSMFTDFEEPTPVTKADFELREQPLRIRLLRAQQQLRESRSSLLVLVSGVEGAGKGAVVNRLHTWLDARGVRTTAFWDESDEERERPRYWRFWRALPESGSVGVFFGSWYTQPILDRASGKLKSADLERRIARIRRFERMLAADGVVLVKCWYHLSKKTQRKRFRRDLKEGHQNLSTELLEKLHGQYEVLTQVSEQVLTQTEQDLAPWTVIGAKDRRHRDLRTGEALLTAMEAAAARGKATPTLAPTPTLTPVPTPGALASVDLASTLDESSYEARLKDLQKRLGNLAWKARKAQISTVGVFEGWDAAGKGGAIRRVVRAVDARLVRAISIAAPSSEEKAHHYLWRFWRHVPRAGHVTLYDRSWYGRVLVERVEGFASEAEWQRAYQEIQDFEEQLVEHGTVLVKCWLHISPEEQLRRFRERQSTPWKQYKITDEDWRNRDRWQSYEQAVNDMVTRTSSPAPWTLVAANDKRFARCQVLEAFCKALEKAL
jgi:polyphosphate:AMP phosphotransferase